jgi:hypothetical protein
MRPKVQSQGETFRKAFSTLPVLLLWQFLCTVRGSAYHGGGEMDDVGQLRFLLDRLAVVIIMP